MDSWGAFDARVSVGEAVGSREQTRCVCAFARQCRQSQDTGGVGTTKAAFIPLKFKPGEVFQFDWSTEHTFRGGLRRRVELARTATASGIRQ